MFSCTLWSLARGEDFDADADFEQLVNFILSDQIATTNTVLGIGYVHRIEYNRHFVSSHHISNTGNLWLYLLAWPSKFGGTAC